MSEREMSEQGAQFTLGQIIGPESARDAIHVAVAPLTASEPLYPGQHIGRDGEYAVSKTDTPIGIVDPFLKHRVENGQRFWMFLYPNTITSLRHQWTHPSFESDPKAASEIWMREYADEFEMSVGAVLDAGREWLRSGEYHCLGFDTPGRAYSDNTEFWRHFEILTGEKVPANKRGNTFFTCSC